jgi:hypothetical protein
MSSKAALRPQLNPRQTAYLIELTRQDIRAEADQQARAATWFGPRVPARVWRAIEYGPRLSAELYHDPPLRARLREQGLVSQGSGSTWATLETLGLVTRSTRTERIVVLDRVAIIHVLHVTLTQAGRKAGRSLLPPDELLAKRDPSVLSASAWRLLLFAVHGHCHTVDAWWNTGGTPPSPVMIGGICAGLVKRGLVTSGNWSTIEATPAGVAWTCDNRQAYFQRYPYSERWDRIFSLSANPKI